MNKLPRLLIALGALVAGALVGTAFAQDAKPAQGGAQGAAQGATPGATQGGSAAAGEKKAAMCIGCHGIPAYQASFPEIYKVPMIAGQNSKYIVSALTAYKKGDRKHPTMRAIAASLTDQDMADLAAFYETENKASAATADAAAATPSPAIAELLKKGNCISCHGDNFSKPIDPAYPKLAGQHADYLYYALKAYQVDKNPQVGRNNPVMMGMSRPFTHAELKQLSAYLSSLPGQLATVPQARFR